MASLRSTVKSAATPLRSPGLLRAAMSLIPGPSHGGVDGPHILVVPTGGGNIGDEAMLDAYLENVEGEVLLLARSRAAFPRVGDPRVHFLECPQLLHRGYFPYSLFEAQRVRRAWKDARSFSVVGADVMDGGYIWQNSVNRAQLAMWASKAGMDARILGFSWNQAAHPAALSAVRRAGEAGVRLYVRDIHSAERLRSADVPGVVDSADIVFSARARGLPDSLADQLSGGDRPLALVNASGLVARVFDQTSSYVDVVGELTNAGYRVILLPHVDRDSRDDVAEVERVYERLSVRERNHVTLVRDLLAPGEVRELASRSALVVTGRMHLAVIALSQGVPAVVVATQGKVSGLMEMAGLDTMTVEPRDIAGGQLLRSTKELHAGLSRYASSVRSALPELERLSRVNFEGL